MPNLLISWVGQADLRAPRESLSAGVGPIAQALAARPYEAAVSIADYPKKEVAPVSERGRRYRLLRAVSGGTNSLRPDSRGCGPGRVRGSRAQWKGAGLSFHLNPGTPVMLVR